MVQFKPEVGFAEEDTCKHRSNTYWMLGSLLRRCADEMRQELERRGYPCREYDSKAVLADSLGRLERGLLCYNRCNASELRLFCESRGISTRAATVSRLTRILEDADDEVSFPRFFELPPEIRVVIYEYHFNGYETMTHKHHQPPLTLACNQLRLEALPVFYKCVTFEWCFFFDLSKNFYFTNASCNLVMMPDASLAQIKNFSVLWTRYGSALPLGKTTSEIKSYEHNGLKVSHSMLEPIIGTGAWMEDAREVISSILNEVGCSKQHWKSRVSHQAQITTFRASHYYKAMFPTINEPLTCGFAKGRQPEPRSEMHQN
jgi:hypothetical protein